MQRPAYDTKELLGDLPLGGGTQKAYNVAGLSIAQVVALFQQQGNVGALTEPWRQSPWAYTCISLIARTLSQVPLKLYQSEDEDAEEITTGPLVELLRRPNPVMHRQRWIKQLLLHRQTKGGSYLILLDRQGKPMKADSRGTIEVPAQVYPVREDKVEIGPIRLGVPEWIKVDMAEGRGSSKLQVPWASTAHIYDADVLDYLSGFGPGMVGASRFQIDRSIEHYDQDLLTNKGRIPGVLETDPNTYAAPEQIERAEDSVNEEASRPDPEFIALPAGMKLVMNTHSPRDMGVEELRKWNRDVSLALFGCTKTLVGITDDVNRANAIEARRVFFETTGIPTGVEVCEDMNFSFVNRIRGYEEAQLRFDWSAVAALREDAESKIGRAKELMTATIPRNSAFEMVELPLPEGAGEGNIQFVETNLKPLDQALNPPEPPQIGPGPEEAEGTDEAGPIDDETDEGGQERGVSGSSVEQRSAGGWLQSDRIGLHQRFIRNVKSHEKRITTRASRVMRRYIDANLERIKAVAEGREMPKPLQTIAASVSDGSTWNILSQPGFSLGERIDAYAASVPAEWVEIRNISDRELDELLVQNAETFGQELWDSISPILLDVATESISDMADLIGLGAPALITASDEDVVNALLGKQVRVVEGPISTLAQRVKRVVAETLANADVEGTLQQRLASVIEELQAGLGTLREGVGSRAAMIARTEVAASANAARFAQMRKGGVTSHEWLSVQDEDVRKEPSDHTIDGEVAVIGSQFSNGLRYPGDPMSNSAAAVVNCRCTTLPVIER